MTKLNLPSIAGANDPKVEHGGGGAIRSAEDDKIDWTLLPKPELARVALLYMAGLPAHGRDNWKGGIPTERFLRGIWRHLVDYELGDKSEDHLAAIVFGVLGIMFNEHAEKGNPLGPLTKDEAYNTTEGPSGPDE